MRWTRDSVTNEMDEAVQLAGGGSIGKRVAQRLLADAFLDGCEAHDLYRRTFTEADIANILHKRATRQNPHPPKTVAAWLAQPEGMAVLATARKARADGDAHRSDVPVLTQVYSGTLYGVQRAVAPLARVVQGRIVVALPEMQALLHFGEDGRMSSVELHRTTAGDMEGDLGLWHLAMATTALNSIAPRGLGGPNTRGYHTVVIGGTAPAPESAARMLRAVFEGDPTAEEWNPSAGIVNADAAVCMANMALQQGAEADASWLRLHPISASQGWAELVSLLLRHGLQPQGGAHGPDDDALFDALVRVQSLRFFVGLAFRAMRARVLACGIVSDLEVHDVRDAQGRHLVFNHDGVLRYDDGTPTDGRDAWRNTQVHNAHNIMHDLNIAA